MANTESNERKTKAWKLVCGLCALVTAASGTVWLAGCHSTPSKAANANFFTSGSREADQRASQRMAGAEQLSGQGEGGAESVKEARVSSGESSGTNSTNSRPVATEKQALYYRLGSDAGISNIVVDFTARVLDDPRVNWDRKGVTRGGFSLHRGQSETWQPTPQHVATLERHLVQFLALATGGPAEYTGKEIEATHSYMHISNPEFDAVMGDLKASLDKLKVPNVEQKELLAIVESTRPEIVTER